MEDTDEEESVLNEREKKTPRRLYLFNARSLASAEESKLQLQGRKRTAASVRTRPT